jgi:hypothetical protein
VSEHPNRHPKEKLSAAIKELVEAEFRSRQALHLAVVTKVDPLEVEFVSGNRTLTEDKDLILTQWLIFYRQHFTLAKRDNVLVCRVDGDWYATDVVSDDDSLPIPEL